MPTLARDGSCCNGIRSPCLSGCPKLDCLCRPFRCEFGPLRFTTCAGELVVLAAYALLNAWFLLHYGALLSGSGSNLSDYIARYARCSCFDSHASDVLMLVLGRVTGHLNELNIALVFLPPTRNSVSHRVSCLLFSFTQCVVADVGGAVWDPVRARNQVPPLARLDHSHGSIPCDSIIVLGD